MRHPTDPAQPTHPAFADLPLCNQKSPQGRRFFLALAVRLAPFGSS